MDDYGRAVIIGAHVCRRGRIKSRLREQGDGPSSAGLILGATFLVAGVVLTLRDPNLIKAFIPAVGAASWITLLMSRAGQRKPRPGI